MSATRYCYKMIYINFSCNCRYNITNFTLVLPNKHCTVLFLTCTIFRQFHHYQLKNFFKNNLL